VSDNMSASWHGKTINVFLIHKDHISPVVYMSVQSSTKLYMHCSKDRKSEDESINTT
jgi:hypothetical protein